MDDWLFENQEKLTPSGVREAAQDIGGVADFNGRYAEALKEVGRTPISAASSASDRRRRSSSTAGSCRPGSSIPPRSTR